MLLNRNLALLETILQCFGFLKEYFGASLVAQMLKHPPANAGDLGSIPGSGRSPGGGHGNPLQDSCLEKHHDQRSLWATVHGVTQSWTRLSTSQNKEHFKKSACSGGSGLDPWVKKTL